MAWSGYVLGFALGGFFDGILLHQVLQWHHLLSLVDDERVQTLRTQILADGLFHVLMYAIATIGLVMLWRARQALNDAGAGRVLLATLLIGFGVWNVIDVVGFHWIAGIHRIRVDVDNRLFWDLLWLALFALPPLVVAALIARRSGGRPLGPAGGAALGFLVVLAGGLALKPPPGATARPVLFSAETTEAEMFAAATAVNARVVWIRPDAGLMSVALEPGDGGWALYRHGALLVGGPGSPAACLSWSKA